MLVGTKGLSRYDLKYSANLIAPLIYKQKQTNVWFGPTKNVLKNCPRD